MLFKGETFRMSTLSLSRALHEGEGSGFGPRTRGCGVLARRPAHFFRDDPDHRGTSLVPHGSSHGGRVGFSSGDYFGNFRTTQIRQKRPVATTFERRAGFEQRARFERHAEGRFALRKEIKS